MSVVKEFLKPNRWKVMTFAILLSIYFSNWIIPFMTPAYYFYVILEKPVVFMQRFLLDLFPEGCPGASRYYPGCDYQPVDILGFAVIFVYFLSCLIFFVFSKTIFKTRHSVTV